MSIQDKILFSFDYDDRGYGYLKLWEDGNVKQCIYSRSGSCDSTGKLVNAIHRQTWYIISGPEVPVPEEYDSMHVKGAAGNGFKARLWPYPAPRDHDPTSHYLLHPDGGKSGTTGCIGFQDTNAIDLNRYLTEYFKKNKNKIIPVIIGEYEPKKTEAKKMATDYSKTITAKKTTGLAGMGTVATLGAHAICSKWPGIEVFINSAGLPGKVIVSGLLLSCLFWAKDYLKHKTGVNIPF